MARPLALVSKLLRLPRRAHGGSKIWSCPSETDEDDQGLVQAPLERNLRDRVRVTVGSGWTPSTGSPGHMAGMLLSPICVLDKEKNPVTALQLMNKAKDTMQALS